jgi:hypothetical protein
MPSKRRISSSARRRDAVEKAEVLYSCATQAGDHPVALQAFAKMASMKATVAGNTKRRQKAIAAAIAAGETVRDNDATSASYDKLAQAMESPSKDRCDEIMTSFVPLSSPPRKTHVVLPLQAKAAYARPYVAPTGRESWPEPRGSVGKELIERSEIDRPRGSADIPFKAPPPKPFTAPPPKKPPPTRSPELPKESKWVTPTPYVFGGYTRE